MELVAINTIERMDGKKRVTVNPGEKFTASGSEQEGEAKDLLDRKAARKLSDIKEARQAQEKRTSTKRTSADQNVGNPDSDKIGDDSVVGLANSSNTEPALPAGVEEALANEEDDDLLGDQKEGDQKPAQKSGGKK